MYITLLNGSPAGGELDDYLSRLKHLIEISGHTVTLINLRQKRINYCMGCFGCWVKTPGECVSKDEAAEVCREVINSDLTLMASPVSMGFVSALLKKMVDKLIPLLHPYLVIDRGEVHHQARYPRYPRLALLLECSAGCDDEDIQIINRIFSRTAINFKSDLAFTCLTHQPIEEVLNEINGL